MTPSSLDDPTPILVTWLVFALLGLGVYVWYALMLSKVFTRLGAESWKAWVPILNEAEILRLGGVPAWSVVFFFLPVVHFYGLYLKAVATSRINAHFGRGAGSTALAILVPPVWATLLAGGARTVDPALQERIAPSVAERSGYAFAVTPQPPSEPVPPALLPPAGGVPFVPATPPAPVPPPIVPAAAPAPPPVAPPPPVAAPAVTPPPPVVPAAPAPALLPPPPGVSAPGPIVPPPGLVIPPPPVVPAAPLAAPEIPAQPWAPLDRPIARPPVAAAPEPEPDDAADELDRTVVVDRRPVVPWVLLVDDGPTLRLSGTRVVLGRRPAGAGEGAQELAVPDATRTLSKVHARLDLADGVWTVTDLNATNGVIVIGADGAENLLDPGASAPVVERFVLGKVGLRLVLAEGDADR